MSCPASFSASGHGCMGCPVCVAKQYEERTGEPLKQSGTKPNGAKPASGAKPAKSN
ncbi:hypothetical protein JOD54_002134 [Actinokineospora baliensis]|nr:hypothetical protein [Actinokineospora baliensis]